LSLAGFVVVGALGNGDPVHPNAADAIGSIGVFIGLVGLIPYGTVKILYNPDLGPFKPAPTPTISKGVAFTFGF
jgi:hypothetical protein